MNNAIKLASEPITVHREVFQYNPPAQEDEFWFYIQSIEIFFRERMMRATSAEPGYSTQWEKNWLEFLDHEEDTNIIAPGDYIVFEQWNRAYKVKQSDFEAHKRGDLDLRSWVS